MKLGLLYVKFPGDLKNERVVFKALDRVDIGSYIVTDSAKRGENEISVNLYRTYWLPDKVVEKGDVVVLYTRDGTPKERTNTDGTVTYFLYRGRSEAVWKNAGRMAVLLEVADWMVKEVKT